MRVLLVEDEALIRMCIADELSDAGFEVVEAVTGDEALRLFRDADVLFTDIRLPGSLDGWDIAEACRVEKPDMLVIYATGFSAVDARPVSGSVFFRKPYRAEQITRAIHRLAQGHG